jgi:hypothetical protein
MEGVMVGEIREGGQKVIETLKELLEIKKLQSGAIPPLAGADCQYGACLFVTDQGLDPQTN